MGGPSVGRRKGLSAFTTPTPRPVCDVSKQQPKYVQYVYSTTRAIEAPLGFVSLLIHCEQMLAVTVRTVAFTGVFSSWQRPVLPSSTAFLPIPYQ